MRTTRHCLRFSTTLSLTALVAVLATAFVLYVHTVHHDFVWDDYGAVVHNRNIRSWKRAGESFFKQPRQRFTPGDPSRLTTSNYRPLRTLAHAALYSWRGGSSAGPYHLLNVLGHACVCSLVFLFFLKMFRRRVPALFGALLFAAHPVNSEVVCWVKSLEDLLAAGFLMATALLFPFPNRDHHERPPKRRVLWAPVTFVLALLAKLSASFFPVFTLLNERVTGRGRLVSSGCVVARATAKAKAIFRRFGLLRANCPSVSDDEARIESTSMETTAERSASTGFANATTLSFLMLIEVVLVVSLRRVVVGGIAQQSLTPNALLKIWLSMPRIFLRYLRLEIFPVGLLVDYRAYPAAKNLVDPVAWMYAALFAAVMIIATWFLHKKNLLPGWLWFWTALLPFANVVPMVQLGAERFLYIPTIGFAWLIIDVLWRYRRGTRQFALICLAMVSLLASLSIRRSVVWRDGVTLWEDAHRHWPSGDRIKVNLIKVYNWEGRHADALPLAEDLYRKAPDSHHSWLLGYTLFLNGKAKEGVHYLIESRTSPVLNHVGLKLVEKGNVSLAAACFYHAYNFSPENEDYRNNLAVLVKNHPELLREARTPSGTSTTQPASSTNRASSAGPRPGVVK